jgi:hypothetical protein
MQLMQLKRREGSLPESMGRRRRGGGVPHRKRLCGFCEKIKMSFEKSRRVFRRRSHEETRGDPVPCVVFVSIQHVVFIVTARMCCTTHYSGRNPVVNTKRHRICTHAGRLLQQRAGERCKGRVQGRNLRAYWDTAGGWCDGVGVEVVDLISSSLLQICLTQNTFGSL